MAITKRTTNIIYLMAILLVSILIINNIIFLRKYTLYGYSYNIYNQLPTFFWITFFLSYAIGVFVLLSKCPGYLKKACLLLVIINYVVFLVTPSELGYSIFGDGRDDISYLGEINSIIKTGNIDRLDIYPVTFILNSIYSLIISDDVYSLPKTFPIIISLLFITGIILLAKIINIKKEYFYILLPVSLIFYLRYMHFSLAPHYMLYSLTPLGIFIFAKIIKACKKNHGNHFSYSILATIIIIAISIGHPHVFIFWVFLLFYLLYSYNANAQIKKSINNFLLITLIIFLTWLIYDLYYLKLFGSMLQKTLFFMPKGDPVFIQGYNQAFNSLTIHKLKVLLKTVVFLYARYFIPFLIVFIFYFKNKIWDKKKTVEYFLMKVLLVFCIIDFFFIFNPIIIHTPIRATTLNYFIYILVPFFALVLYKYLVKNNNMRKQLSVVCILTISLYFSVFGALPSPHIYESNSAITMGEIHGWEWIFNNKNELFPIVDTGGNQMPRRFCDLFYGLSNKYSRKDQILESWYVYDIRHFGYDKSHKFPYDDLYITSSLRSKSNYLMLPLFSTEPFFTKKDYNIFENYDSNIINIYANSDICLYMSIRGC